MTTGRETPEPAVSEQNETEPQTLVLSVQDTDLAHTIPIDITGMKVKHRALLARLQSGQADLDTMVEFLQLVCPADQLEEVPTAHLGYLVTRVVNAMTGSMAGKVQKSA